MIFLIGLATVAATLIGGLFAIKFRDRLHLILGFSAGAVIGVGLFDLIPESINLATQKYPIEIATLFIAIGFTLYMVLDRAFSLTVCKEGDCHNEGHHGPLAAGSLSLHSFLDGLGIGLAFKVSPEVGWIVAAAVLAHDFSDGINTVNVILFNQGNRSRALQWLLFDAIMPIIGVTTAYFINVSEPILGLILAVFAGLFLYLGASELIPESHHHHPGAWTTIVTILGIITLFLVIHLAS